MSFKVTKRANDMKIHQDKTEII